MLCKCSGKYIDIYFILKITFQQVIRAGTWVLKTTFTSFYFSDVTRRSMDILTIECMVADQQVM